MATSISSRIKNKPDEDIMEVVDAIKAAGSIRKLSSNTGVPFGELQRHYREAALRGLLGTDPVLPGFEITSTTQKTGEDGQVTAEWTTQRPAAGEKFELPTGMKLAGVSALTDGQGYVKQAWQIARKDSDLAHLELVDYLKTTFDELTSPHIARSYGYEASQDLCTLIPCNDWHINMLAWEREVGENWDLKIAERRIWSAMESVIKRSPPSQVAIILGGGDMLHSDTNLNRTAASGAVLDCDSRHAKGKQTAIRLLIATIDLALDHHATVYARFLKGNHDEYSSVSVAYYLSAWFRNDPRVIIDLDESLYWSYQWGQTMLAGTHGHTLRMDRFPQVMAGYWPKMWGETKFRYGHFFHIHHSDKVRSEGGAVVVESHRAPVPKDGWHYGCGYMSGRDVQTITYHRDLGERGRTEEVILDA